MPSSKKIQTIRRHVARAKSRLRVFDALRDFVIAIPPAALLSIVAVILYKHQRLSADQLAWACLVFAGAALIIPIVIIPLARSISASLRKNASNIAVSTRLDKASGLRDRLSNATTFYDILEKDREVNHATQGFMLAAIDDGAAHLDKVDVKKAIPFVLPEALPHAIAALIGLLFVVVLYRPIFLPSTQLQESPPEQVVRQKPTKPPITLDPEDIGMLEETILAMRQTAKETADEELERLADELQALVTQAKQGELTHRELLDKTSAAEAAYSDVDPADNKKSLDALAASGKELAKSKQTKALGKALLKKDLTSAEKEIEKLAANLENNTLSKKDAQTLSESLAKGAEALSALSKKEKAQLEKSLSKAKADLEKLDKKISATNDSKQKQALELKRKKKKAEVSSLEKKKSDQASPRYRELERLQRDMKKAADSFKSGSPNWQKQASKSMRDIQRSTSKIRRDRRKIANKKRVASQMDALKEAMRRARRNKGGKGNDFKKNRRESDFRQRAMGRRGQSGAWKPGAKGGTAGKSGKASGGKTGGSGAGSGTGSGDSPFGDPTQKTGNTKDVSLQGVQSKTGTSVKETLLSAAERGFSTKSYKDVYEKYRPVAEEVVEKENVPTSYKYYVRRYFQKIRPTDDQDTEGIQ